ncbi:TIGR00268 family protein [Methanofollis formosanus]|uniref:TIGR00268 family protein n=1 Tax=Methanofollis formosanus TaxID=299308 RepID=A0A8G1A1Z0_9EURY|nr:7-cyano-7-deazaguanine synthase [Methanofollis formosanus]QYZ79909.1 TIGR00268 family protein [Methanofollis formosanus]
MLPDCLLTYLRTHAPLVVALSGGTDSAVLLAAAVRAGVEVAAVTVDTGLVPPEEVAVAARVARTLRVRHETLAVEMLAREAVRENTPERCYVCKRVMMERVIAWAEAHGYRYVVDGTHAGDDPAGRPGVRALAELGVLSPFAACDIGREELLALADAWGVEVRPSSSCMATRIPTGTVVTVEAMRRAHEAEEFLRRAGIPGRIRVRVAGRSAKVEVPAGYEEQARTLVAGVRAVGFDEVEVV